jgi:hypothetical protein
MRVIRLTIGAWAGWAASRATGRSEVQAPARASRPCGISWLKSRGGSRTARRIIGANPLLVRHDELVLNAADRDAEPAREMLEIAMSEA